MQTPRGRGRETNTITSIASVLHTSRRDGLSERRHSRLHRQMLRRQSHLCLIDSVVLCLVSSSHQVDRSCTTSQPGPACRSTLGGPAYRARLCQSAGRLSFCVKVVAAAHANSRSNTRSLRSSVDTQLHLRESSLAYSGK